VNAVLDDPEEPDQGTIRIDFRVVTDGEIQTVHITGFISDGDGILERIDGRRFGQ
jgi:hypothetical protein